MPKRGRENDDADADTTTGCGGNKKRVIIRLKRSRSRDNLYEFAPSPKRTRISSPPPTFITECVDDCIKNYYDPDADFVPYEQQQQMVYSKYIF